MRAARSCWRRGSRSRAGSCCTERCRRATASCSYCEPPGTARPPTSGASTPATTGSEAAIARVVEGPQASGWSEREAALLRAADELHEGSTIAEAPWAQLAESYGERELIELTMLVGEYHLMAFALNALGVADEDGASGLPARAG